MTWVFFGLPPRVRRTIDGVENIDRRKSYVIVLNHTSGVDIIAAYKIPLNFRWVSKREVFRIPFFGPMLLVHGIYPSSGAMRPRPWRRSCTKARYGSDAVRV